LTLGRASLAWVAPQSAEQRDSFVTPGGHGIGRAGAGEIVGAHAPKGRSPPLPSHGLS
jgi:hypothetical protein